LRGYFSRIYYQCEGFDSYSLNVKQNGKKLCAEVRRVDRRVAISTSTSPPAPFATGCPAWFGTTAGIRHGSAWNAAMERNS